MIIPPYLDLIEKDKIDKEHSERLENLQKLLIEKEQIDEKQEKEIRLLIEYTEQKNVLDKEQSENIQKIMDELKSENVHRKVSLVFSIAASAISVGTLILFILRFYLQ
jgi:intergrase/recombinase